MRVLPPDPDGVPGELKPLAQWLCWRAVWLPSGRLDKPPVSPHTGHDCDAHDPGNHAPFDVALVAYLTHRLAGIGFDLTEADPYAVLDQDHCVDDDGTVAEWALANAQALGSYTELTPSRHGLRTWVRGTLPPGRRSRPGVELYDSRRYLTVTGWHLAGTPTTIEDRQRELEALHAAIFPAPTPHRAAQSAHHGDRPTVEEIAELLRHIPPTGDYQEHWLSVLMAVHAAYPDETGVALCEDWSPGYPGEVARKFQSFKRSNGIGVGTLYHLAKQHGWAPPKSRLVVNGVIAYDEHGRRVQPLAARGRPINIVPLSAPARHRNVRRLESPRPPTRIRRLEVAACRS